MKNDVYEVRITEPQRARIEKALGLLDQLEPLTEEELQDPNLQYLLACVKSAPEDQLSYEGEGPLVHGWCL